MPPRTAWASFAVAGLTTFAVACSLGGLSDGERDASLAGAGGMAGIGGSTGGTGGTAGSAICDGGACPDASAGTGGGNSCASGSRDGNETDIDCGGTDCPKCALDRACTKASDCLTNVCTGNKCACPAQMAYVPTPISEGVSYCVDHTEVTNEQYDVFLKKFPDGGGIQPDVCAWNTTFVHSSFANNLKNRPQHPVVNVDWCDARAYCAASGKRLCGKLGGGPHLYSLPQSATDEWYVACSQAGKNVYVYGNSYDPDACAMKDQPEAGPGTTFDVGSFPKCKGGYEGIVDMNGNVWEWEDSCNDVDGGDAAATACRRRGGGFDDSQFCARCSACGSAQRTRNSPSSMTGFRCCAG